MRDLSSFSLLAPRVAAFVATFLFGLFGCPCIAIVLHSVLPARAGNFLFFWPQFALVPYGFTHPAYDVSRVYLSGVSSLLLAVFWLLVGIALAWLLRSEAVRVTALATIPVSFVVALAAWILLSFFDVGVYLEGP